ncbi:FimV/HubP family polar landmark protein [Vibrio metoecus]|uniref:FimV/HubP family polar landmark protein n=1 Tax=Vibrio metoecus TaxID=1481663 RepID=UPI0001B99B41|nr:FimV/HubP family polar landmark protein [Vibrio metoecus]EEX65221.1 AAA ATPase [Vibrio metoecus]
MRRFFQRLLLPAAVMVVTQISFVSAESIRLVGPNGQVQPTPQYSDNIVRNSANNEPGKFFGPTTGNQTLWSIATQLRPSPSVTVQQTLLAIYQLNPQAFENQNIHTLIPGSTLRVPSLAQISRNSNQEAVNIMAAHQAKLNQAPVAPAVPARPVAPPKVQEVAQTQPEVVPQPKVEEKPAPEIKNAVKPVSSETEVMALEEKNHTLRVMLSEVQSEVSSLKQELGDENRIRSEVEKLLEEERRKAEEAQRLAPSSLDNLLSNGWLVALLALIPGLLIAIVVLLLLNRRSAAQQDNNSSNLVSETPTAAPVTLGPEQTDDIGDDLLLDDDLFSTTDEKEESASEDKAFSDDDVFADLNETDLDFNLDGQDSEDLFVGIDDDGDLDTEFDALNESANGISVNGDDKALGLEEMERALNDVTTETEDDDLNSFDLADEHQMSEDDIEALLSGDAGHDEPLEDGNIDQSLLDDLLASELDALDEEPELQDTETLDTLLNDELDLLNTEGDDEFDLSGAGVVDEQELDDLFASIEEQADLEHLEANAVDETALLDEILAEHETPVADNSTELLEELLDEFDTPETDELGLRATHLAQADEPLAELEQDSTQLLDEVLGEPISNEELSELDIDQNSTELLDELLDDLDLDDESIETSEFSVAPEKLSVEDGTELFDELLEIEQQAEQVDPPIDDEFNSDTFIDDLLNSAPATDPLLEPQRDELESIAQADDFDFNPEIEGSTEEESAPLPQSTLPANEFGIPQDDDWVFEEEISSHESDNLETPSLSTINDLSDTTDGHEAKEDQQDELLTLNDLVLPEETEEQAFSTLAQQDMTDVSELDMAPQPEPLAADASDTEQGIATSIIDDDLLDDFAPELSSEQAAVEPAPELSLEPEVEQEFVELDELELPEFTEEEALAEALQTPAEPELEASLEPEAEGEFVALDELDLPEFTEEEALAEALKTPAEPELEASLDPEVEQEFVALDELDLPEFTEEEALAEALKTPAEPELEASLEPEVEQEFVALDELDLPEFTEEEALAEALKTPAEPELEATLEPEAEDEFAVLDELELPEFTEEDALAETLQASAEEPELEVSLEPEAEDEFTALDELELPEFTEEEALAEALQASAEEPELEVSLEPEAEEEFTVLDELELPEFTEEDALAEALQTPVEPELEASLDPEVEQEFVALDELDLPEFTEEEALAEALQTPAEPELEAALEPDAEEEFVALDELDLPEFTEEEALAEALQTPAEPELEASLEPEVEQAPAAALEMASETPTETFSPASQQGYDEDALHDWLSERQENEKPFSFDRPLDAKTIDSAGMDIDAMLQMGGEDWNGFHLTPDQQAQLPDDVPEDEQAIWASETPEPQAKPENWGSQEDLLDFDPQRDGYMTIDELMAQVESEEQGLNPDEEELKLDVGLDEFPDVIGDIRDIDVDSGAEAAGKLDLAKIYIEMNDEKGAIKLLEEAIVDGDDEIRQQAKRLIDVLNGRV